ncbi:putative toxin-antitoxin system toxin component, PIN family (plasmid) [Alicyclobacillus sp. TC]|uniref:PIN family toxin of toxin-antitoxin system n=1 Tax=Alicyclobacillus tolerans TaxID=90970 RepID=A0ABT9M073_9BACL|nr:MULTISPECIES: putative toxin-antitoxin system toxin component, PIN family [Alicyclobacillus]MDP9729898.1 putative PIN family toxin of toxin-antitoxin system [Alicyclobacillus tengchongensis]QRF24899.1 putative toxin-antitoxin system toxin component, PIN family [Alicyclobacillus sp. TC]
MKVVLDTNVFISGLLMPQSVPGRIVQAWKNSQYTLVMSEALLNEIERVLNYPKIQRRLHWEPEKVKQYVSLLRFYSELVSIEETLISIPRELLRDEKDYPILATYISGQANWLVSGDEHFQDIRRQYSICTPSEFLKEIGI